ncbi:MAG: RNA methyltransferase [Oscillospiraceae bacterium]
MPEEITSRTSERVKDISKLCADSKTRKARGLCVAHGFKLCLEAARHGAQIEEFWATPDARARFESECRALDSLATRSVVMTDSVCAKLTEDKSPQGAFAVLRMPETLPHADAERMQRVLALCGVQDPANVGAALRTAAALGYAVAVDRKCADLFAPKTLRASMGAAFALKIVQTDNMPELLRELAGFGFATFAAALRDGGEMLGKFTVPPKLALTIGSEGAGLPADVIAACSRCVEIPMTGAVESLNAGAAAAILMWELRI